MCIMNTSTQQTERVKMKSLTVKKVNGLWIVTHTVDGVKAEYVSRYSMIEALELYRRFGV